MDEMENKTGNIPEGTEDGAVDTLATPASPEQVEQWREQAGKADEYYQRLLLEAANFENYKKRAAREKQDAITYANEALLQKLIPVMDNFGMALAASSTDGASAKSLQEGVKMISSQLKNALAEAGLEEIDATGKKFDPNLHEAVSETATTEAPEGHVAQQIRKGYRFRTRLLRPASVVVAKKP